VHGAVTLVERGSILMFQTILAVSLTRKAVVADRHNYADRHNPITYVKLIRRLLIIYIKKLKITSVYLNATFNS